LLSDIRTSLYERLGAEQSQSEWEERALKAEAERDKLAEQVRLMRGVVEANIGICRACDSLGYIPSENPDFAVHSGVCHLSYVVRNAMYEYVVGIAAQPQESREGEA